MQTHVVWLKTGVVFQCEKAERSSARKLKEVFGVPVSCVTVKGYLHLVLWNTSELLVLCVTLVFLLLMLLVSPPVRNLLRCLVFAQLHS